MADEGEGPFFPDVVSDEVQIDPAQFFELAKENVLLLNAKDEADARVCTAEAELLRITQLKDRELMDRDTIISSRSINVSCNAVIPATKASAESLATADIWSSP